MTKETVKDEPGLKLVGTRITPEQSQKLTDLAAKEHRSVSAELRRMIEQRLEQAA